MAGRKSWSGPWIYATVRDVFETVTDLAGAVTGILNPDGPLGGLTHTLTDALDSVWAQFFSSPTPPGGTNWNAYSHEQLYKMVWDGADVGDVGAVADDWGKHSSALTAVADALRGQGTELRSNWQGRAADQAADRLAELSDRVWSVGARASTVQKATSDAGDALALARNTMPKPPPEPMTLMSSAVGAGPMPPLNAVLIGGARLFTGDAVAGASKAEAVRVMQRYETSLRASGNQVVPPPSGATDSRNYEVDGPQGTTSAATAAGGGLGAGGGTGGVPWSRLVGGVGSGATPTPGGLVGAGPAPVESVLAAENAMAAEAAAKRGMGPGGGFMPGMAGRGMDGEKDKRRNNKLPNVDNGIFAMDERTSAAVIGDMPDRERNIGL